MIQLSFLSLMTMSEMSPTFGNLFGLGMSCGFNKISSYNMSTPVDAAVRGV